MNEGMNLFVYVREFEVIFYVPLTSKTTSNTSLLTNS